jgi:hypothetical protein
MGMDLSLSNVFHFISAISPLLLGFFLVMTSIFNQDLKGFVYLAGILFATIINVFVLNMVKSPRNPEASSTCNLVNLPFNMTNYNNPSLNSVIIAFTMAYLIMPMQFSNQMNYSIISFLFGIFLLDGINKTLNKCTTSTGVILGLLLGGVLGFTWYSIFHAAGYDSLLYFNEVTSNKVYCARPKKQTFKCAVYKNGELVKTL